ncbi:hypothetical protein [Geodermatophilus sp. FMUSA9-8]|uniref:hypothetical protein n=1 Tax=Geodermatophilus sp. FMUSA9-8 TaxID=3120155 RepID=UPI0030093D0F
MLDLLLGAVDRSLTTMTTGGARRNADVSFSSFFTLGEHPSPVWGVWLGDIAHNLRSALDNVVTALLAREDKRPGGRAGFPLYLMKDDWLAKVAEPWPRGGPLAGVAREDFDVIESAQPFMHQSAEEKSGHPLATLARVNNRDKHAALHATLTMLASEPQRVLGTDPPARVEILWSASPLTPLESGMEITRWRVLDPVQRGRVFLNWPLKVIFMDHKGQSVGFWELEGIHSAVSDLVNRWDGDGRLRTT